MYLTQPISAANRLLTTLPGNERDQLLANCESIQLIFDEVLYRAGDRIRYIYFPTGSFISLLAPINGAAGLEVGMIGNEGMLGITLLLGIEDAPFQASVQGAGPTLRIAAPLFLRKLELCPILRKELNLYLYVSIKQLAQTARCTKFHVLEARLARWLLMAQDRAHSDRFHVTHVCLADMLGVRRVGVTKAANLLQTKKLISYHRGDIIILDRGGLEQLSCGCYRAGKEIYDSFLGSEKG